MRTQAPAWPQSPHLHPTNPLLPRNTQHPPPSPPHVPMALARLLTPHMFLGQQGPLPFLLKAGICSHLPGRCRHSRASKLLPRAGLCSDLQGGGHSPSPQGLGRAGSGSARGSVALPEFVGFKGAACGWDMAGKLGSRSRQQERDEVAGQRREEAGGKKWARLNLALFSQAGLWAPPPPRGVEWPIRRLVHLERKSSQLRMHWRSPRPGVRMASSRRPQESVCLMGGRGPGSLLGTDSMRNLQFSALVPPPENPR